MRLSKLIASARLASRRGAETLIEQGRVTVNGVVASVTTPVEPTDKVLVDGRGLPFRSLAKWNDEVFICYKLRGELVTYSDPQNRPTLFQRLEAMNLPKNLIAVGRLDMQSEGLLLLTTDGEYARQLELPSNHIIRTYRARIRRGEFNEKSRELLEKGLFMSNMDRPYRPINVDVVETRAGPDGSKRQWLDVSVTEGQYREVRRALGSLGMDVDRLIRIGYGPYKLGDLKSGSVLRVKKRELS